MKIAFLTPEYPHKLTGASGGLGTSIKNLAYALIAKGVQVSILVYGQQQDTFFEEEGIHFYMIKNIRIKRLSWYLTRKKIQKLVNQLHKENKIDLIEAPDWTGITSFINVSCPIVIRLHGSDTYFCHLDGRKVKPVNFFHEKRTLQQADAVTSVSRFTGELTNTLFGLQIDFKVIPNTINTEYFKSSDQHSAGSDILYFGSIIRKKGLLELPFIFNKVVEDNPQAKLHLIGRDVPDIMTGNNSTWEMMQTLFSEKALKNVVYSGSKPYEEIKLHIQQAAICVFPSFAEALPVSWLEAMALGKAIVASDIGWAKEVIDDGVSGFLVSPKDHLLFASKITALLQNPDMVSTFGKKSRQKIETDFSTAGTADRNIAFYNKIIKNET